MDGPDLLRRLMLECGSGPLLDEMPRNTLAGKGIAGPTAAHRIEEVHTPLNLAYLTFTTGSSAFQNPVGVTWSELPARTAAGRLALKRCGLRRGDEVIVTYPPLVNVFTRDALEQSGISCRFIQRPSRDALLVELCEGARCVIGESSFLRAALQDAWRMSLGASLPKDLILIAAGTPLDLALPEEAGRLPGASVHDLYGCQEFGWLALDGTPLREDVVLCEDPAGDGWYDLLVGGLPTGDRFRIGKHPLDPAGTIRTDSRVRSPLDLETTLLAGDIASRDTALRAARTILRLKAKIVRIAPDYQCGAETTILSVGPPGGPSLLELHGPERTRMVDTMVEAQKMLQREAKTDPVWHKHS